MTKVLFLYPRSLDPKTSSGGVAEFLCALSPRLKTLGIEPIIYAGDKSINDIEQQSHTLVDAIVYNGPFFKPGFTFFSRKLAMVLSLCRRLKIDVLHAQGTYTAGCMAREINKRLQIPYVVTSHSDILSANSKRINRPHVQRRCQRVLQSATVVTHLTPMMEAVSNELWNTASKNKLIGNGIGCHKWQSYLTLPEKKYLLGIGRLEPGKGFHILISMYAELLKRGIQTSLIIAGKGSEEANLIKQAQQLNLNCVTDFCDFSDIPEKTLIFTGYVRGELKKQLMAQSQIVLFATQPDLWEEAFGIVQLEAMAAGKAMIASDTVVTQYLQKLGMQVCIVQPDDIHAWVNQTALLLQDTNLRTQMGIQNSVSVRQFDWDLIAKQYAEVYTNCLASVQAMAST